MSNRFRELNRRKGELRRNIWKAEQYRQNLKNTKDGGEWNNYYSRYIKSCLREISNCDREIGRKRVLNIVLLFGVFALVLLSFFIFGLFLKGVFESDLVYLSPGKVPVVVQKGEFISTGTQLNFTISPVNVSQAFVLFRANVGNNLPKNRQFTSNLPNSTTVSFDRYAGTVSANIVWQVVESPDFNVQRGSRAFAVGEDSANISLQDVNLSNTFVIVEGRCADATNSDNHAGFFAGNLTNQTNLLLRRGNAGKCAATASWQVVQWNGANVQSGEARIADSAFNVNVNVNSVNLSETFLIFRTASLGTDPGMDSNLIQGKITSPTSLSFTHEPGTTYASSERIIDWYLVSVPLANVQNGTTALNADTSEIINQVNVSSSFHVSSGWNTGGGQAYSNSAHTINLTDSTTLSFDKQTGSQTQNIEWFVIETAPVEAIPPEVTIVNPQNITYSVSNIDFNISLNEEGSSAWYTLDNGLSNVSMSKNGLFEFGHTNSSIADGSYTVKFYVNDTVGNLNDTESVTFSVDSLPSYLTILDPLKSAPLAVNDGDNITVIFNFTHNSQEVTSNVVVENVTIGGLGAVVLDSSSGGDFIQYIHADGVIQTCANGVPPVSNQNLQGSVTCGTRTRIRNVALGGQWELYVEAWNKTAMASDTLVIAENGMISYKAGGASDYFIYEFCEYDPGLGAMRACFGNSSTSGSSTVDSNDPVTFTGVNGTIHAGNHTAIRVWAWNVNRPAYYMAAMLPTFDSWVNLSISTGSDKQVWHESGVGWKVNVTVPNGLVDLQDLFVNATSVGDGITLWATELSAIDYGGIDLIPPGVDIISPSNITYNYSDLTFNVTLDEDGDSVIYSFDYGLNNYSMSSVNLRNYNASNNLGEGNYVFSLYANDTSGNRNDTEDINFSVDTAPTVPTNILCNGATNCDLNVDINVTFNSTGSFDLNNITYFIEATLLNSTVSNDQETGISGIVSTGGSVLGESGFVDESNFSWSWVSFSNNYTSIPVVLTTPASDITGDNNAWSPAFKDLSLKGFNVSMCKDTGAPTCNLTTDLERIHWIAFDRDAVASLSWISVGNISISPNGVGNTVNWGKTFVNVPYVFASPQSYNQVFGELSAHAWVTGISTTQATGFIGCTHQGISNSCDGTTATENFGWVAIDPVLAKIDGMQMGSSLISNSFWTSATFNPNFVSPIVAVLQNSENGAQDPQYPWARNVLPTGFDFRYCEQDAFGVCNSHNAENVVWMALEQGNFTTGGLYDTDSVKGFVNYTGIFSTDFSNLTELNVEINISNYNASGSVANGNRYPDLQVEMYNGSNFIHVGNFSVGNVGMFSLIVNRSDILIAWENFSNTNLRIGGIDFDYVGLSGVDQINWTDVYVSRISTEWVEIGNHTENEVFLWNTTNLRDQECINLRSRAIDFSGSGEYSDYFVKNSCLNISHPNNSPFVYDIEDIPFQTVTQSSVSNVSFYTLISDIDGANDLNHDSVFAEFSKVGEDVRIGKCDFDFYYNSTTARYSCNIGIWYWDGAGVWNVSVIANDSGGLQSAYYNESFELLSTPCIVSSPKGLSWNTLFPGDTDLSAINDPIIINNTCNYEGVIQVSGIDLLGVDNSAYSIPATNFSVDVVDSCNTGTVMVNGSAITVAGSSLLAGNNSAGQGQEQLYFCIEHVPDNLLSQFYSTDVGGSWQIILFAAAFVVDRRRKKKKGRGKKLEKLDEKYREKYGFGLDKLLNVLDKESKNKFGEGLDDLLKDYSEKHKMQTLSSFDIPVSIFRGKLSPAEALCKYLRENKGLRFSEIAIVINRNERTVWVNYRNASNKMKRKFKVIEKGIEISSSLLNDRKLSILESLVLYFRNKGFSNPKISEILRKDCSNVCTLYNRALNKLGKEKNV